MSRLIDLTGQKYGYLTVIKRAENNKFGNTQWLCKCDCGNEKVITGSCLVKGNTKSCGCKTLEMFRSSNGIIKPNNDDLDKAILKKRSELKRKREGITVTNDKSRLMYLLISAQIEVLESLHPKYEEIGMNEYRRECKKKGG